MQLERPASELRELDEDDEDVFAKNLIDRYAARSDALENLSPAEFAALWAIFYRKTKNQEEAEEVVPEVQEQDDETTKQFDLKNGLRKIHQRWRKAIIRWHNCSKTTQTEKHYRSKLLLFLPWRDEDSLKGNCESHEDMYQQIIQKITEVEKLFTSNTTEIDEAPQHAW